ncbi:MAG TPA: helix-hairpin-helix domain-containing protein [Collinsella ihuae]|uniref:Helix-hairpin-helix domain-containing protein n=1 Tax=Collinsella ihumii TaxID=1720204 RepID=A0A921IPW7_9ACTN|nr:helix-hairpin-helix domain-containing protein [Collinsella ihumii]
MAQLESKAQHPVEVAKRRVRQNPALLVALLVAAMAIAAVCAIGIWQATGDGVLIEQGAAPVPEEDGVQGDGSDPDGSGADGADAADDEDVVATPSSLVVDVDGAVSNPGVYELAADARVNDAIQAAGGLTSEADAAAINRAALLTDGQKVYVPHVGEEVETTAGAAMPASPGGASSDASPVNINTASVDDLDTLPGVGPSTAQAIVDDRAQNGAFASIEDIMRVSGIGEKKFEKLKGLICV